MRRATIIAAAAGLWALGGCASGDASKTPKTGDARGPAVRRDAAAVDTMDDGSGYPRFQVRTDLDGDVIATASHTPPAELTGGLADAAEAFLEQLDDSWISGATEEILDVETMNRGGVVSIEMTVRVTQGSNSTIIEREQSPAGASSPMTPRYELTMAATADATAIAAMMTASAPYLISPPSGAAISADAVYQTSDLANLPRPPWATQPTSPVSPIGYILRRADDSGRHYKILFGTSTSTVTAIFTEELVGDTEYESQIALIAYR
ncbi:MAG TPA: hypothetical protein VEI02_08480 [Planctomycetota bacterium]|nr:hypothetical protein [Planctomycetota bacterium]